MAPVVTLREKRSGRELQLMISLSPLRRMFFVAGLTSARYSLPSAYDDGYHPGRYQP